MQVIKSVVLLALFSSLTACGFGTGGPRDSSLVDLTTSAGALSPAFAAPTFAYTVDVPFLEHSVRVTATATNPDATIRVDGVVTPSGTPSQPVTLFPGPTPVTIDVISPDGIASAEYTVVFTRVADFVQQGYIKASNTDAKDNFGHRVALSGDLLVVGAPSEASSDTGIDGAQGDNSNIDSGAAYIFRRVGSTWSQEAYLKASNSAAGDRFGWSVAVSGDTVIVGARFEGSMATGVDGVQDDDSAPSSGAAYVFTRNGPSWIQQAYLKASNTGLGDQFGVSVAVDDDTVVVGAFGEASAATGVGGDQTNNAAGSAGAAYVFTRTGTTWSQQAYLKASNTDGNDFFGGSVAVHEDTIVVGAHGEGSNGTGVDGDEADDSLFEAGAAYAFVRSGAVWSQQAYLKASNTDAIDQFGAAVALAGDTLVIGAVAEDSNATTVDGDETNNLASSAGAAYVFVRADGSWSQEAYLKAPNANQADFFGSAVGIVGDTVVVGAPGEASEAVGVDGDPLNNLARSSGAAYVFFRSGGGWNPQIYIKASNTGANDLFGFSVALDGNTIVAGALQEDSITLGVDGDGADDSATDAGAAYVLR